MTCKELITEYFDKNKWSLGIKPIAIQLGFTLSTVTIQLGHLVKEGKVLKIHHYGRKFLYCLPGFESQAKEAEMAADWKQFISGEHGKRLDVLTGMAHEGPDGRVMTRDEWMKEWAQPGSGKVVQ